MKSNYKNLIFRDINDDAILEDPRKILAEELVELGKTNKDIVFVSIDSSLGASGGPFNKSFPERHFEFGIAEQNGMGEAAGMATCGKIPFIAGYVPFVSYRCFEQVRDDVCKTNLNVNIIGNNSGFSVSTLGPTHVVLEDVGVLRSLPNLTILSPADGTEYRQVAKVASEIKGPVYIRVSRIKARKIFDDEHKLIPGKADILKDEGDITIIATGTMTLNALVASSMLEARGIKARVINMSTIKPIDEDVVIDAANKTKKIVTVEEHSVINGLGAAVAEVVVKNNPVKMKFIGTPDKFAVVGSYEECLDYYNLTPEKIALQVADFARES
ncbi:MAG TPA: transketolase [Actinobacteria bacterium]|nr:transketolase [Actinomycetota bacterium]